MGYDTAFLGHFQFSRTLSADELQSLREFTETRHEQPVKGERDFAAGELPTNTIDGVEYRLSDGCPSIYCPWQPSQCGNRLAIPSAGKHEDYVQWLGFLKEQFFDDWGIQLSGRVLWRGEEFTDVGLIAIVNGTVECWEPFDADWPEFTSSNLGPAMPAEVASVLLEACLYTAITHPNTEVREAIPELEQFARSVLSAHHADAPKLLIASVGD